MTWDRSRYYEQIKDAADALTSTRWNKTSTSPINLLAGAIHLLEWRKLLNVATLLRVADLSLTRDSNGRVPVSSLTTGSGDTQQSFHRVLQVRDAGVTYRPEEWPLSPLLADPNYSASTGYTWRREGDYLVIGPLNAGGAITVRVNHLPRRIDELSGDTVQVTWPDGFEHVLVYETAGRMLMKGGAETDASRDLKGQANEFRKEMYDALGRTHGGPKTMRFGDDPAEWGAGGYRR